MSEIKEVIILGCGPTHVDCRYHTETWGVNGCYTFAKRMDKLFMSDEESEVQTCWYDLPKMAKSKTTLVLPVAYERIQQTGLSVEIFPIEEILKKFPTRFFSNTIAYMLAYALLHTITEQNPGDPLPHVVDGYHKIYFYGIDMMDNSSYVQEKGGVEFWMGIALAMGVEIINTKGSATGKTWNGRMYGHYGKSSEEMAKEKLLAPWDLVRTTRSTDEVDEWIKISGSWTKIPAAQTKDPMGIPNF